jgi:hypothetical protein
MSPGFSFWFSLSCLSGSFNNLDVGLRVGSNLARLLVVAISLYSAGGNWKTQNLIPEFLDFPFSYRNLKKMLSIDYCLSTLRDTVRKDGCLFLPWMDLM